VEDYPTLPELPDTVGSVDAAVFATAVEQVTAAAGRDETLPMMTGVRLELVGDRLSMLATDRYRLAVREIPYAPTDPGIDTAALIPASTLRDTAKALASAGGPVQIAYTPSLSEGVVGFTAGRRKSTSRLLDGTNYPPVRSLFPTTFNAEARVEPATLIEVVKRVALVAERTTPVVLTFNADGLLVEAGGTEDARASEATDASFNGEPLTVAFNPQYLIDGLTHLGAPTAVLSFVDAFKPAVIQAAPDGGSEPDPTHKYLIMPIRVTR
jgi:DNA polymerase-3 subunit beta